MKKLLVFIIISFLFTLSFNISYAWCYPNESIMSKIKIKPKTPCIDVLYTSDCTWGISLLVGIKCEKDYYILDEKKEKIKLESQTNFTWYNKVYEDYTIPQYPFYKWKRQIINKDNPNEIYYVYWKIYYIYLYTIEKIIYIIFILFIFTILYKKWIHKKLLLKIKNIKNKTT